MANHYMYQGLNLKNLFLAWTICDLLKHWKIQCTKWKNKKIIYLKTAINRIKTPSLNGITRHARFN